VLSSARLKFVPLAHHASLFPTNPSSLSRGSTNTLTQAETTEERQPTKQGRVVVVSGHANIMGKQTTVAVR